MRKNPPKRRRYLHFALLSCFGFLITIILTVALPASSQTQPDAQQVVGEVVLNDALVTELHERFDGYVEQKVFNDLVKEGKGPEAFELAFELGDEAFEHSFTLADGVGANVGNGLRFTRIPRADLDGPGEWANHTPFRLTGPNAQSCQACHNRPVGSASAGMTALNVIRDPLHAGTPESFIVRNTTSMFGSGALQRLAEEMTDELWAIRDQAVAQAKDQDKQVTLELHAKGIPFGQVSALADGSLVLDGVEGVDDDLVVKPFQWKGSDVSLRQFMRDATHRELGLQATELVGREVDGDFDGVINELSAGDLTGMVIYAAAQPRPTTSLELASLGLAEPLSDEQTASIEQGEQLFHEVGCTSCHTPSLSLDDPIFSEPSQHEAYRDAEFPSGLSASALELSPEYAVRFDLSQDQPDNRVEQNGSPYLLGAFAKNEQGQTVVALYGDLKRHDMGPGLAEPIDETGAGASVFLTKELWGVADTAPYLHDGRATTLAEAILWHGGEAEASRAAFEALELAEQKSLISFLDNLKIVLLEERWGD